MAKNTDFTPNDYLEMVKEHVKIPDKYYGNLLVMSTICSCLLYTKIPEFIRIAEIWTGYHPEVIADPEQEWVDFKMIERKFRISRSELDRILKENKWIERMRFTENKQAGFRIYLPNLRTYFHNSRIPKFKNTEKKELNSEQ